MPRAPRGKRVINPDTGSFMVVGRAPNGEPEPYFDRTRQVWVAPWKKPDGKVGRPTGKTRAAAVASRDRHVAAAEEAARYAPLAEGFTKDSTLAELGQWWLDNVARHRVRPTTIATYTKQMRVVFNALGEVPVRVLRPEQVAAFVSHLVDVNSASRALNVRALLVQVLEEAVNLGLAEENVGKKTKPPRVPRVQRRTLTPAEIVGLLQACDERFVAAVALCFVQGWRVSEALGLAWEDVDFDAGTALCCRAATYLDGHGMILGPTKTRWATGRQLLGPTVLELLRRRRAQQLEDQEIAGSSWLSSAYEGAPIRLVFTTQVGKPMLRQHVDKAIRKAATSAGLDPTHLGTHAGRRSVVTSLYASGDFDLSDVARFVGHSDVATTRGYAQHEGDRPLQASRKALKLLDPGSTA